MTTYKGLLGNYFTLKKLKQTPPFPDQKLRRYKPGENERLFR